MSVWPGVAAVLLERRVRDRAAALHHRHRAVLVRLQQLDEAEVDQLDDAPRCQLDVGRLDVAVQDGRILRVQVGQRIAQLRGPAEHVLFGDEGVLAPGFVDQLAQVRARHEIHDQVLPAVLLEVVGDFGQVGVVEAGEDARLPVELILRLVFHARRGR